MSQDTSNELPQASPKQAGTTPSTDLEQQVRWALASDIKAAAGSKTRISPASGLQKTLRVIS